MTYELLLLPVAVIVVVLIVVLDVLVREVPRLFNVKVSPHTSALTVRVRNITSKRRRDIDKVRNLREEECFSQGGVFAHKVLDR